MANVILGTGGHAKALRQAYGLWNARLTDGEPFSYETVYIGVGDLKKRRELFLKYRLQIPRDGQQIMEKVHIGPDCAIGSNVLINTGAQIDHGCTIGIHSIIAPGAILCGDVRLGGECFIGAGAIIMEGVELESETYVPAGTLVCGPDDFRKPIRMVRANGADFVELRQEGANFLTG